MRINGVYLSYDIYDRKQMEAVKNGGESIAKAYESVRNGEELSENDKEKLIAEVYAFFGDVFSDDKAIEVLGENANLTECICACADFIQQSNDVKDKITGNSVINGNRQMRRATVHKRK